MRCACEHWTQTHFDDAKVRVCNDCDKPVADQRSPIQIASELATTGGLVGELFQDVADLGAREWKR